MTNKCELDRVCTRYLEIVYPVEAETRGERRELQDWLLDNDFGEIEDRLWHQGHNNYDWDDSQEYDEYP